MKYRFSNIFLERKDILSQNDKNINPFLKENNEKKIEELYDFYIGESPILCVTGFRGTGKVQIVDYSLNFLSKEVITLKYNCFESTVLDDILLVFFYEFKKLQSQKTINPPKIATENFNQKINSYFSTIEKPILIVIDSFEELLAENKNEILDFLSHLTTFSKIKIIIISRTYDEIFDKKIASPGKITLSALNRNIFTKLVKSKNLKFNSELLDDFYKYTHGYYFNTILSYKIINAKQITLNDFILNFKNNYTSFNEYLERESAILIPPTGRNLYWFLSLIRHEMNYNILKKMQMFDENIIKILKDNGILLENKDNISIQDYFRDVAENTIPKNMAQKIHSYIVDFYKSQLPLKPFERDVMISRFTMRKEIEYHEHFLPKRYLSNDTDVNMDYVAYAKKLGFDLSFLDKKKKQNNQINDDISNNIQQKSPIEELLDITNSEKSGTVNAKVEIKNLPFELSKEEMDLLENDDENTVDEKKPNNISVEINQNIVPQPEENGYVEEILTLPEIIEKTKVAEEKFNYKKMIDLLENALSECDETELKSHLPLIYTKLAFAYQKLAKYDDALENYELAQTFYEDGEEFIKANFIKLNIAKIFFEIYKIDHSKALLTEILQSKDNPSILTAKTYLALANIEDSAGNVNTAYNYYKNAVEISNDAMDVETLSELYFKYALSCDDKNDTSTAVEFYRKCITLDSDAKVNKFLSSAYANIASLYMEKNDKNMAFKYYYHAYQIDENANNYDGMYFTSSKMAQVLEKKYPQKAIEYLKTAQNCAKVLNDTFYIASATLALGDFYYDKKDDEKALEQYFIAYNLIKNDFSKDNLEKINIRINDIKFHIGVENFENLKRRIENE